MLSAMTEEINAHSLSSLFRKIRESTREYPRDWRYCSMTAVVDGNVPLFCCVRVGVVKTLSQGARDYGRYSLLHETLPPRTLVTRLKALPKTQTLSIAGVELSFPSIQQQTHEQPFPSGSVYHERPGTLYELASAGATNSHYTREPLLGPGLAPYFHVHDAITQWTGIPVNDSDARFFKLLLFLPTFDARLTQLSYEDGKLTVKSICTKGRKFDLAVLLSNERQEQRITTSLKTTLTFDVMEDPTRLHVFLTNAKGEILDRFMEEATYCTGHRVIFGRPKQEQELLRLIYGGESDLVEFKTFIKLDDNKKWREVVETVIAFANSQGGTILIGIEDNGQVSGIGPVEPLDASTEAFYGRYRKKVHDLMRQHLNRTPPATVTLMPIAGHMVLVIRVDASADLIYAVTEGRKLLVRRGASNTAPDWDSFLAAQSERSLFRIGEENHWS
jgi:hypothetical protein